MALMAKVGSLPPHGSARWNAWPVRPAHPQCAAAPGTRAGDQHRTPAALAAVVPGPGRTALGHAIEVVSGREEARLIYLGVAHAQPPKPGQRRLVIDIGGGSTEFIIGMGMQTLEREACRPVASRAPAASSPAAS